MSLVTRAPSPFNRAGRRSSLALATVAVLAGAAGCSDNSPTANRGGVPPAENPPAYVGSISGTYVLRQVEGLDLPWSGWTNNQSEVAVSSGTLTITGERTWTLHFNQSDVASDSGAVTRSGATVFFDSAWSDFVGGLSDSGSTITLDNVDLQHGDFVRMKLVRQ